MKTKILKLMTLALMPAGMLVWTSCSSTSKDKEGQGSMGQGSTETTDSRKVRSEVETYQSTATVTAIDQATRRITLTAPDGKQNSFVAGPEVRNFDQIHVGDQVKTTYTQSLAVSMRPAGTPPSGSESSSVEIAPKGAKPGLKAVDTKEVTAKILSIDQQNRTVNLQFADGTTREVKVRPDVDLTRASPGESVTMRVAESTAIEVEKP